MLTQTNSSDIASAPTGCASALIDGSTHFRSLSIPSGPPLYKLPTNIKTTDLSEICAIKTTMCKAITVIEDKHSMKGRPLWGWSKHRCEELRRPCVVMDKEENIIHKEDISLTKDVYNRPWGGIPFLYSFGHCGQLPPVMMKAMYDKSSAKSGTADQKGKIAIHDFLYPSNKKEAQSTVVVMNEVLRQEDSSFKSFLHRVEDGSLNREDVEFIHSRCFDKLNIDEKLQFMKHAIHLVPQWKQAHDIVYNYLRNMNTPLAKLKAQYNSILSHGINHCVKELSFPSRLALRINAKVMLIKNYIVEWKVMNGSVGTVIDIVYKDSNGPMKENTLPEYVIVDFPYSCIPSEHKIIPNQKSTHVAVPIATDRCEKKCCSVSMMPLIVCIAITIHKAQGMTIEPNQMFEKVVIYLPEKNTTTTPGLD